MRRLLKHLWIFPVVLLTMIFCFSLSAYAEGSKDLVESKQGYRPYLEWDPTIYTANISRKNVLKVYAKSGETISLGSSVAEAADGKDIVVRTPSGVETIYDVLASGQGYIDTYAKETAGPNPDQGGYTPIVISVKQTGVWEVEFHSPGQSNKNPAKAAYNVVNTSTVSQQRAISAWDITVSKNNTPIEGRVFANYVAMNTGFNMHTAPVLFSKIYVLTKDGYQYQVDFNGLDPYGFVFYANNRGLIDSTNDVSLYRNGIGSDLKNDNLLYLIGGIQTQLPNVEDTATNITHMVFFNPPAADLPSSMPTRAQAPAKASNLRFVGNVDGETTVGSGGTFYMDFDKTSTYELMIDVNHNGVYEKDTDVILANAATDGSNSIYWDGKDAAGNNVPIGEYTATLTSKGGEYHFPLLDAENNINGLKIQLLNAPYTPDGFNANTIYYDNSSYTTANGTFVNTYASASGAVVPVKALDGVDSSNGALRYANDQGNNRVMDIWTYFPGNQYQTTFKVQEAKTSYATVSGTIYFDKNKNAKFDGGEQPLSDITVTIADLNGNITSCVTNASGRYSAMIPAGKYTIKVSTPTGYSLTTQNDTQSGTAAAATYAQAVGYYLSMDVGTTITADKTEFALGEEAAFTITATNYSKIDATNVIIKAPLPASSTYIRSTENSGFEPTVGLWSIGTMAAGESRSITVTLKPTEVGDYTYSTAISASEDTLDSNNSASVDYKVIGSVIAHAPYQLSNNYAYIFGRTNTEMQPKDNMLRGEASAVLYRLLKQNDKLGDFHYNASATPAFSDIAGRWDRSAIEYMTSIGVYTRNENGKIAASSPIKRQEAFKLFALALGFTDDTSLTYDQYASILQQQGYVEGYGNGDLGLQNDINRAEYVVIYNKIIGRDKLQLVTADGSAVTPETYGFVDIPDDWTREPMLKATSAYDESGYVDIAKRAQRNILDDYE